MNIILHNYYTLVKKKGYVCLQMLQSSQSTKSVTISCLHQMLVLRNRNLGERTPMSHKRDFLKLVKETSVCEGNMAKNS